MDRDFMIMIWSNLTFTEINAETQQEIVLDDLIPVDILIKAVHRILVIDTSMSHNALLQQMLTTVDFSEDMTLDGTIPLEDISGFIAAQGAMSFYTPEGVDQEFVFLSSAWGAEDYIYSSKYINMPLDSNEVLKVLINPDNLTNTITAGDIDIITILECVVR